MSNEPRVRWGILGTARIAKTVAAAIHASPLAELTAVASRSGERAADWAAEHNVLRSFGSYAELIEDAEIDAVYIPLPPSMHREWTIRAAEQGKHVLCEKPLAACTADAEEMAAACRELGRQLMDGVMWLHHPRAGEMLDAIRSGGLGELRRVTSAFSFCWNEIPTGELRLSRELGGGSLLDLGWYCVGAAMWAFDELPRRVRGDARWYQDVDMNFSGLLWFGDDRVASFDSGFDTGLRKWLEVAGTAASLVCDDFTRPWNAGKPRFWVHDPAGKADERICSSTIQEVDMIDDFCRIVASERLDDRWPAAAVNTQRVCEALDRSARGGRAVEIDG